MAGARFRDRVEDAAVGALEAGIARLPERVANGLGAALGSLARRPFGVRAATVRANLERAFPAAPPEWIDDAMRGAYRHLGREALAMMRLSHLSREEVIERTVVAPEDWSTFRAALDEGRGVLLVTGHHGNWEVAAAAVAARGVPIGAIVKRLRNPLVDARLAAARARLGIETIDMRVASKRVPRLLASGGVVGIVGDQDARSSGVFVPFFGVPASTYRGPALFALRLGAAVLASVATRLPDGRYRVAGERVAVEPTGDLDRDVVALTASLAEHLERQVRRDPTQYFWFHRRWKTAPPGGTATALPGTTDAGSPDDE